MSRTRIDDDFAAVTEALFDRFIAANGQSFDKGVVVAKNLGPRNECWSNARTRCNKNPKLQYAEGYVLVTVGVQPVAHRHAFCVDKRGTVVEVTEGYEKGFAYAGMILNLDAVNEISRIEQLIHERAKHEPLLQAVSGGPHEDFLDVSALQMALWSAQQGEPGSKEMLEWLVGL